MTNAIKMVGHKIAEVEINSEVYSEVGVAAAAGLTSIMSRDVEQRHGLFLKTPPESNYVDFETLHSRGE